MTDLPPGRPEPLGHVSTEGGPLVIGDRLDIGAWTGITGNAYEWLCGELIPALPRAIQIRAPRPEAVAWNVPTGTTFVWRLSYDAILLTRTWVVEQDDDLSLVASVPIVMSEHLGRFHVRSGWLAVMWAAEGGFDLLLVEPEDGLALDLSVGHAALVASLPPGDYECWGDEVEAGQTFAMRCLISRRAAR